MLQICAPFSGYQVGTPEKNLKNVKHQFIATYDKIMKGYVVIKAGDIYSKYTGVISLMALVDISL